MTCDAIKQLIRNSNEARDDGGDQDDDDDDELGGRWKKPAPDCWKVLMNNSDAAQLVSPSYSHSQSLRVLLALLGKSADASETWWREEYHPNIIGEMLMSSVRMTRLHRLYPPSLLILQGPGFIKISHHGHQLSPPGGNVRNFLHIKGSAPSQNVFSGYVSRLEMNPDGLCDIPSSNFTKTKTW